MKKQILFIHGAGVQGLHQGSGDLAAYLQDGLGADYDLLYPIMPDSENPEYEPWKVHLKKELAAVHSEVILIGHSLGGAVLLKYLSEGTYQTSIAALFVSYRHAILGQR
ncbi:alpha/beta hydrolase [Ammoniphilus sp. 3BR4]